MQWHQTQQIILTLLADGQYHKETELQQALFKESATLKMHLQTLVDAGVSINYCPQQGYQLSKPLFLLDEKKITTELQRHLKNPFQLHLFSNIDSTNRYLKEIPSNTLTSICCAEQQTQGRGRFDRKWHSPFGENIYCSSRWHLHASVKKLSGLSLVTSLAIMAALEAFNRQQDIKIKWPNDILWQNKKLCGSLIELIPQTSHSVDVIIGIGLNVNSDTATSPLFDKPWCSLFELTQTIQDKNLLIAQLIIQLERYLTDFIEHDLAFFSQEWQNHDYLQGKIITVTQGNNKIEGVACGIDSFGQLILKDQQGKKWFMSSGDATLRNE